MKQPFGAIVYVALVAAAMLHPFDFDSGYNHAEWIGDRNGIRFGAKGIAISPTDAAGLCGVLAQGRGLTLEAWLKTGELMQDGPARILSFSSNPDLRNFTLAQSADRLVVRLRTESTDPNGLLPHLEVPRVFMVPGEMHVAVTYDFKTQCLFIDGLARWCGHTLTGGFANWDSGFRLAAGNEVSGDRPWLGEIYYAAIYDQALEADEILQKYRDGIPRAMGAGPGESASRALPVVRYRFDQRGGDRAADSGLGFLGIDLHIPDKLPRAQAMPVLRPSGEARGPVAGLFRVLHILLFIPFGALLYGFVRPRVNSVFHAAGIISTIGIAVSLGFEMLQHFIPERTSSLGDAAANATGLCLGIAIARMRFFQGRRDPEGEVKTK